MTKILISACLYGHAVRYDGKAKRLSDDIFEKWQKEGRLIPVCSESAVRNHREQGNQFRRDRCNGRIYKRCGIRTGACR